MHQAVADDYRDHLAALWDHFHRNPELPGLEAHTSARMAEEFRALGLAVTSGVGGHGVVAVLRNGPGPTVLVRADMDGLPLRETSGLENASTVTQVDHDGVEKPVMHACGHDAHITALVGTARQMAARRDRWSGTLVLIAQPAEETLSGARAMMEDGLYDRFPKPDYALAFHVVSGMEAGLVQVPLGAAYSSSDSVDITVRGVGAHGASPHLGVDPVLVASQIVVSLQSIVSRDLAPLSPGVITVGAINGGVKHNIIPDRVDLQLTVRADDFRVREQLLDAIDRVAQGTARALGVPDHLAPVVTRSQAETTPPTVNDAETAHRVRAAIGAGMGEAVLIDRPRRGGMSAEDFAYLVAPDTGVRGAYFMVGGRPQGELANNPAHHSPFFRIEPEPAVRAGVTAMVLSAEALLAAP